MVDAGLDVAADRRLAFRLARLMGEVDRDVARRDVRVGADLRVSDLCLVRHLRSFAEARVLGLHERAYLRTGLQHRSWAKLTDGPDHRVVADLRVDRDHVRAD